MSKARTLADLISDNAELADGQISVAEVVGAAPLASPTFTGTVTSTGNIALGNDDELVLGSNKMRLYYNDSNNYTVLDSNGTQGFVFDGVNNLSVNIGGSLSGAFTANGVSLYSGGTEKLQVYGSGTIALDDIKVNDDVKIGFGQFHTDLELYHDSATTTNKLVGDLTQTGKLSTDELDLSAISDTISDTAVDIFVYDTRKDSDGGAWRKRTQHTSWYNEAASSTRGSRKEFPAVAVIVAEAGTLTIYDGDDPDLPMWMVFNGTSDYGSYLGRTSGANVTAVHMLNGVLCVSRGNSGFGEALLRADFIKEFSVNYAVSGWLQLLPISGRNEGSNANVQLNYTGINPIVNIAVNDVAMTVLPNAPIDAATGLPVPTIAVATDDGWSQISDDGNVYDFAFSTNPKVTNIAFKNNTTIAWNGDSNQFIYDRGYFEHPLLTADKTSQNVASFTDGVASYEYGAETTSRYPVPIPDAGDGNNHSISTVIGNRNGLSVYDALLENRVTSTASNGMVAYIASDYATGWQNGAVKLATLSDTDDTNVTGSELVTNGTFDSDVSGWTVTSNGTFTYSSNTGVLEQVTGSNASVYQTITTVSGQRYTVRANVTGTSARLLIGTSASSGNIATGSFTTGTKSLTFTASGTTTYISIQSAATVAGLQSTIDNVSVRLAEEDRSVNGNGLQVFGTVTKSAVSSGADLVGYQASDGNYLLQPENDDLAFGMDDFAYMFWAKATDGTNTSYVCSVEGSGGVRIALSGGHFRFHTYDASNNVSYADTDDNTPTGKWVHVVCVRRNGVLETYRDGEYNRNYLSATTIRTLPSVKTTVLATGNGAAAFHGQLALFRISATAPSPEQIKYIYDTEKFLFQENAQATLYGSSDTVTALAYDDSTELLHVGTSAGRSVFQGLRRVDNTTTAVGAAISASNGLVADE